MNKKIQSEVESELDAILALLPNEQMINVTIRYESAYALKKPIVEAREKLEGLRAKLREEAK